MFLVVHVCEFCLFVWFFFFSFFFLVYVLVPCRELLDGPGFPADAVDLVHRAYFAVWGVESHINVHPLQLELGLELIP